MIAPFVYAAYAFPSWTCRSTVIQVARPRASRFSFPVAPPRDQTSQPHPISSMVTKIRHHAAIVYVTAARW